MAMAWEFETVEAAGRKAKASYGGNVVVVLRYDRPECELALNPANFIWGGARRVHHPRREDRA